MEGEGGDLEGEEGGGGDLEEKEEGEGGDLEEKEELDLGEKEELDDSEMLRVKQLQPEDSILMRSLTGRHALGTLGVTQAVNLGGDREEEEGLGGDGDIEEPSLDDTTDAHVKDMPGEVWNLQEEDLADDEGDYLDYELYDEEIGVYDEDELEEPVEGFLPEEGSAGPVIEYQEFVSLNPVKVFNEG